MNKTKNNSMFDYVEKVAEHMEQISINHMKRVEIIEKMNKKLNQIFNNPEKRKILLLDEV